MTAVTIFNVVNFIWEDNNPKHTTDQVIMLKNVISVLNQQGEQAIAGIAERYGKPVDQAIYEAAVRLMRMVASSERSEGLRLAAMKTLGVLADKGLPVREGFEIAAEALFVYTDAPELKSGAEKLLQKLRHSPTRSYVSPPVSTFESATIG